MYVPKILIIIPTYNERDNISKLINDIFNLNIKNLGILVVDDNSPDGTGQLVEKLKQEYVNLDILHRQSKQGLGKAYLAGFKKALEQENNYIFEMDGDLSHNPEYIPIFLNAIQEADLVLGSRYVKNGGIDNWGLTRRLVSRFGNIYARIVLNLPYKDLTGGFKCYRRKTLENIDLDSLSSIGYNFQIETTYKVHLAEFKIKEIPIIFTERKTGVSKFNLKIIMESFWNILKLRFGNNRTR